MWEKRIQISIYLPVILRKKLQRKANQMGMPVNKLTVIILQDYVRSCTVRE